MAARVVAMCSRYHNIKPIPNDLHWLPVKQRILFKVLHLVYKSKNNLAPESLRSMCIPYRKSNHLDLIDSGPKSRMKAHGYRSFKIAGAEEWNKLPLYLNWSLSVYLSK